MKKNNSKNMVFFSALLVAGLHAQAYGGQGLQAPASGSAGATNLRLGLGSDASGSAAPRFMDNLSLCPESGDLISSSRISNNCVMGNGRVEMDPENKDVEQVFQKVEDVAKNNSDVRLGDRASNAKASYDPEGLCQHSIMAQNGDADKDSCYRALKTTERGARYMNSMVKQNKDNTTLRFSYAAESASQGARKGFEKTNDGFGGLMNDERSLQQKLQEEKEFAAQDRESVWQRLSEDNKNWRKYKWAARQVNELEGRSDLSPREQQKLEQAKKVMSDVKRNYAAETIPNSDFEQRWMPSIVRENGFALARLNHYINELNAELGVSSERYNAAQRSFDKGDQALRELDSDGPLNGTSTISGDPSTTANNNDSTAKSSSGSITGSDVANGVATASQGTNALATAKQLTSGGEGGGGGGSGSARQTGYSAGDILGGIFNGSLANDDGKNKGMDRIGTGLKPEDILKLNTKDAKKESLDDASISQSAVVKKDSSLADAVRAANAEKKTSGTGASKAPDNATAAANGNPAGGTSVADNSAAAQGNAANTTAPNERAEEILAGSVGGLAGKSMNLGSADESDGTIQNIMEGMQNMMGEMGAMFSDDEQSKLLMAGSSGGDYYGGRGIASIGNARSAREIKGEESEPLFSRIHGTLYRCINKGCVIVSLKEKI